MDHRHAVTLHLAGTRPADLSAVADGHVTGATERPRERGSGLRPQERLRLLGDDGSLQLIRSNVTSERMGEKARPGDGVLGGSLRIAGRPVFAFAQDATYAGGSVGARHADTIVRIQRLARQARVPVIGFIESGGARMQEGLAALDGYARVFREHVALSGEVPQISVITGMSAGGGCYSPALTDFVVMTQEARMFLTGETQITLSFATGVFLRPKSVDCFSVTSSDSPCGICSCSPRSGLFISAIVRLRSIVASVAF